MGRIARTNPESKAPKAYPPGRSGHGLDRHFVEPFSELRFQRIAIEHVSRAFGRSSVDAHSGRNRKQRKTEIDRTDSADDWCTSIQSANRRSVHRLDPSIHR